VAWSSQGIGSGSLVGGGITSSKLSSSQQLFLSALPPSGGGCRREGHLKGFPHAASSGASCWVVRPVGYFNALKQTAEERRKLASIRLTYLDFVTVVYFVGDQFPPDYVAFIFRSIFFAQKYFHYIPLFTRRSHAFVILLQHNFLRAFLRASHLRSSIHPLIKRPFIDMVPHILQGNTKTIFGAEIISNYCPVFQMRP